MIKKKFIAAFYMLLFSITLCISCSKKTRSEPSTPTTVGSLSKASQSNGVTPGRQEGSLKKSNDPQDCTFSHLDLNLCIFLSLPQTIYLGQSYPISLIVKSMDTSDDINLDDNLKAKVSLQGLEEEFLFSKGVEASGAYSSQFIFDQVGEAKLTFVLADEEDVQLDGELKLDISKSIEGYADIDKTLPQTVSFSQVEGMNLNIGWSEDIKNNGLVSERLYKIDIETSENLSSEYSIQWLAFMPDMDHKTLEFPIEALKNNESTIRASIFMNMPGYWIFSVLLLKDGKCIETQLFAHEVKEEV